MMGSRRRPRFSLALLVGVATTLVLFLVLLSSQWRRTPSAIPHLNTGGESSASSTSTTAPTSRKKNHLPPKEGLHAATSHKRKMKAHGNGAGGGGNEDPDAAVALEDPSLEEWGRLSGDKGTGTGGSYPQYFTDAVEDELGPFLFDALYDPRVLPYVLETNDKEFVGWKLPVNDLKDLELPEALLSLPRRLLYIKRAFSCGVVGRMHRDVVMKEMYESLRVDAAAPAAAGSGGGGGGASSSAKTQQQQQHKRIEDFAAFNGALRQLILGQLKNTVLLVQLSIDSVDKSTRDYIGGLAKQKGKLYHGHDPLWVLMKQFGMETTRSDADDLFEALSSVRVGVDDPKKGKQHQPSPPPLLHPTELQFRFEYDRPEFDAQLPRVQKQLSALRATVACTNLHRECEVPDGCRSYCNFDYLQNAPDGTFAEMTPPSAGSGANHLHQQHHLHQPDPSPFYHRIVSLGSNNEFDFEVQLQRSLPGPNANSTTTAAVGAFSSDFRTPNGIWSMTTFDCMLKDGWKAPEVLSGADSQVGWANASVCIGDAPDDSMLPFAPISKLKSILMRSELHPRIVVRPEVMAQDTMLIAGGVTRRKTAPEAKPPRTGAQAGGSTSATFDDISILKIDIEGFEFELLDTWLQDERRMLHENGDVREALVQERGQDGSGAFGMLDFQGATAEEYLSVSQVLMEVHQTRTDVQAVLDEEEAAAKQAMVKKNKKKASKRANNDDDSSPTTPATTTKKKRLLVPEVTFNGDVQTIWNLLYMLQLMNQLGFSMVQSEKNFFSDCCFETSYVHYRYFVRSEVWGDRRRRYHPHHHRHR